MNIENQKKQAQEIAILQNYLHDLDKSKLALQYSSARCRINKNPNPSDAELESCEALTARYARAVDILTQKVLTIIFIFQAENPLSFIDKCNLAEKQGIISNASELVEMRKLRNEIAHEYRSVNLFEMFAVVQKSAEKLCVMIDRVVDFVKNMPNVK